MNHHWRQLDLIWDNKQKSFRACEWSSRVFLYLVRKGVCKKPWYWFFYYFSVVSKWLRRPLARRHPLSVSIITVPLSFEAFYSGLHCWAGFPFLPWPSSNTAVLRHRFFYSAASKPFWLDSPEYPFPKYYIRCIFCDYSLLTRDLTTS